MDLAYAASDIIISRAGASSVSELCIVGKPVIFIPSPNVAEDHQTKNAKYLYDLEAAELIHEDEIYYKLKNIINKIFISDKYRNQLANNLKSLSTLKSTKLIVDEIEKYHCIIQQLNPAIIENNDENYQSINKDEISLESFKQKLS